MLKISVTGGRGRYTYLEPVKSLKDLQVGKFYMCEIKNLNDDGETVQELDLCLIRELDFKTIGVKKQVWFLSGTDQGPNGNRDFRKYLFSQLPSCQFYGPMDFGIEEIPEEDVLKELADE